MERNVIRFFIAWSHTTMVRRLLIVSSVLLGIASAALAETPKKVLLLGQKRDHPPKTHEYFSGLHVLAKCLEGVPGLDVSVVNVDGAWREGPGMIAQADAIVLFLGEGAKWQQSDAKREEALDAFLARGGGFVCLHWAVGAKDAKYIPEFLKALGGMHGGPDRKYVVFRTDVSLASAGHPILSGVEGLSLDDEFYYRLKFAASGMVTPLLSARIDGKPETCAWTFERPGGGRSFGFVGMHHHSNWRLTACRRMIAQAVLWTLKLPIPQGGLTVDVDEEDYQIRPDPPVGSVTRYGPRKTSEVFKTSEVLRRQDWPQLKFDSRRSGDAADRALSAPLGLLAAIPLSDAVCTAPVVADGKAFVVDGAGVVWAIDTKDFRVVWRFATPGGPANCNNVSSPAVAGRYLHVGTMAGRYHVLDTATGKVVREISCGEPIFGSPAVGRNRVYFATLGSKVYALEPDGRIVWTWDYVVERLKFQGDRWSGADWRRLKKQATWRDQFCCTRDLALHEKTLVLPAGGAVVWLEDAGERAVDRGDYLGQRESPATLGLSLDPSGTVFRQWTQRDNNGAVETLRWKDGKVERAVLPGTETSYNLPGLLSFSSVSLRGEDAFRSRPEDGLGLCRHRVGQAAQRLSGPAAVAAPVLVKDAAVYGDLEGALHLVPLSGGKPWSFKTPFGKAISAPAAVSEGRVYFGAEDGYFYVLGPGGKAPPPRKDLQLDQIRSPMPATAADSPDWFTSFGNWANTNATRQSIRPPLKLRWVRRYEGTVKHFSVCGGGRMYTHTAEGQIFAVEQETGRLLWRRYFPGVHVSYTSPLYYEGRLFVPQAGLKDCRLRCLDAATGKLLWEAPFSGSPSWNRQSPPIVYKDLVIYQFSSGAYRPENWLFEHQSTFGFPADQKPLLRAWDLRTGKEVWTRDFSQYGAGGDDAGSCLMGDTVYYSCYFGNKPVAGVTAAIEPTSGQVKWVSTKHALHAGCTISGRDGRLYLGGYNPVDGDKNDKNVVWCLDARDGSLIWKSEPVLGAIHVVTVMDKALFVHAQYRNGYLLDKQSGRILTTLTKGYRCTRFTCCEPYLIGSNFDLFDLSQSPQLVSSGPQLDVLMCVGAVASNGRLFLTTNGSGLQACMQSAAE